MFQLLGPINSFVQYYYIIFEIKNVIIFSPRWILEDFGYVVLQKILHLMVPNLSWYHFFPGIVHFLFLTIRLSLFYKLRNLHGTPTFKTEVLRLVSNVELIKCIYHLMNGKYTITLLFFGRNSRYKATPISYINSKCHINTYYCE